MEFSFCLESTFRLANRPQDGKVNILKVGSDLQPFESATGNGGLRNIQIVQQRVSEILDAMGRASAAAQGLNQPVTSGSKLRMQDEHTVYLLVERGSNEGPGAVLGLLKVGKKNLYLSDGSNQREVSPLCVLDFYVHESRQRLGCGKILFDAMLSDQKVTRPELLAVDRPSPKLIAFLRKHYGLERPITQVNNYVIYEGFFTARPFDANPGPKRARIYMGKLQYI